MYGDRPLVIVSREIKHLNGLHSILKNYIMETKAMKTTCSGGTIKDTGTHCADVHDLYGAYAVKKKLHHAFFKMLKSRSVCRGSTPTSRLAQASNDDGKWSNDPCRARRLVVRGCSHRAAGQRVVLLRK